jgi:hypothetical protein
MRPPRITPPRVYDAIASIIAELGKVGIAKSQVNADEGYAYRGIDDVLKALSPLLARHKLCILPRVLDRFVAERQGALGTVLVSVSLKVAYDFVSARDGSVHAIEAYGEALDDGDKATAKAMSAAYKQAMLQAFCIPSDGNEDSDARSHRLGAHGEQPDPVQGWEQWAMDIRDMIAVCETAEGLDRLQQTYRAMLRAASKRRPELFAEIGRAASERRQAFANAVCLFERGTRRNGRIAKEALSNA